MHRCITIALSKIVTFLDVEGRCGVPEHGLGKTIQSAPIVQPTLGRRFVPYMNQGLNENVEKLSRRGTGRGGGDGLIASVRGTFEGENLVPRRRQLRTYVDAVGSEFRLHIKDQQIWVHSTELTKKRRRLFAVAAIDPRNDVDKRLVKFPRTYRDEKGKSNVGMFAKGSSCFVIVFPNQPTRTDFVCREIVFYSFKPNKIGLTGGRAGFVFFSAWFALIVHKVNVVVST